MRSRFLEWGPILMTLLVPAGCVHETQLYPAPNARTIPGTKHAAYAEAANVRITVTTNKWHADPHDLATALTPVEVRVENNSGSHVRVRYLDMSFETTSGFKVAALPPYNIQSMPMGIRPAFAYSGFWGAPYFAPYFPDLPLWTGVNWSPYWDAYAWPEMLPTRDMVERALPEGVLEPGGYVAGFVYFPELRHGQYSINFRYGIFDAKTNEQVGELIIPFNVSA
jgi:hypothetical protein